MKGWIWVALLGAAAVLAPESVLASEVRAAQVYQPIGLLNGITVSAVTYTGFYSPGEEVEMTCWPNRIWHGNRRGEKRGAEALQENLAFTMGLKISMDAARSWPWRGDTLWATLDVSRLASFADTTEWADTSVLAATMECIKANAGQSGVRVL